MNYRTNNLFAISLCLYVGILSSCQPQRRNDYVRPDVISYQGVHGFDSQKNGVLEWHAASAGNSEEPTVPASLDVPAGLRIRWLGTAGHEISDDSTTILIDPFISRPTSKQVMNNLTVDTAAVHRYILSPLRKETLKVILLSHAHYDHYQDVPFILAQFPDPKQRPLLVGSRNVHRLLMGYKRDSGIDWVDRIGGLENSCTKILDFNPSKKSCRTAKDGPFCDVLILGILARKGFNTIIEALAALKPRYVIPTHYDNFFRPMWQFQKFDVKLGVRRVFGGFQPL